MAFVGPSVPGPLPPISLSGWDQARWRWWGWEREESRLSSEGGDCTSPTLVWHFLCGGMRNPALLWKLPSPAPCVILCGKFPRVRGGGGVQGTLLLHGVLECRRASSGDGGGMQGRMAAGTGVTGWPCSQDGLQGF